MEYTAREKAFLDNTDVVAHIERIAQRIHDEMEEKGFTFYGVPSTIGAERYANVYEYEFTMACSDYSDTYKEAHGFRPRLNYENYTLSQIEAMTKALYS